MTPQDSVTVIVKRKVRPEKQAEFVTWSREAITAAEKFPGQMGATLLTPDITGNENLLIFRFDTQAHLADWNSSKIKADLLARVQKITIGEIETKQITGLEYWFRLPEVPANVAPESWKMVLVTVLGIYPLSLFVPPTLVKWFIKVPMYPRSLIVSIVLILLMTYVVMPLLTRLFKKWLFPNLK